jgi:predicted MFS family arabinose efflux permease
VLGGALGTAIGVRPTLLVAAVGGVLAVLWLLPSPMPRLFAIPAGNRRPPPGYERGRTRGSGRQRFSVAEDTRFELVRV